MKLLTPFTVVGGDIPFITLTFSGSVIILSLLMINPKYCVSSCMNLHLLSFNFKSCSLKHSNTMFMCLKWFSSVGLKIIMSSKNAIEKSPSSFKTIEISCWKVLGPFVNPKGKTLY